MNSVKKLFFDVVKYLKTVRSEVKRISWPSPQELKTSTIVVIVTLVLVTGYLYIVDVLLAAIFQKI
jgi:preprotein translocase subunit SecE